VSQVTRRLFEATKFPRSNERGPVEAGALDVFFTQSLLISALE